MAPNPNPSAAPAPPWPLLASCWEELFPLRSPRLEMALSLAPLGSTTLDAGCATGSLPRALAARGRRAHGLDLEPAFLEAARQKARTEGRFVTWHEASLLELAEAVGDTRFDLVTCLGQTLPHLLETSQWASFFAQVRDHLTPLGHLVIQVVNDAGQPAGLSRELPILRTPTGWLERRRTLVSEELARFETTFHPAQGAPLHSEVCHRRMEPGPAAALLREAGLDPGPALADEGGQPFRAASPGWLLIAGRH